MGDGYDTDGENADADCGSDYYYGYNVSDGECGYNDGDTCYEYDGHECGYDVTDDATYVAAMGVGDDYGYVGNGSTECSVDASGYGNVG